MAGKSFLGGLDGGETTENGRGAEMATFRLVRDGRVHKHDVEDYAAGLKEMYGKSLMSVLDEVKNPKRIDDKLVEMEFYKKLTVIHGHDGEFYKYDKADVLKDTCLLYTSPSPRDATLSRMPSSA